MDIKPMRVDFVAESDHLNDVADSLKATIEKEVFSFLDSALKNAEAEITWSNLCIVIEGRMLQWPVADLFDQLFQWLDAEPEETEGVVERLLPTLKKAVAELEKRSEANDA